jgi:hypothetical protein
VKPIDVGLIKVAPFEFETVSEIRIDKRINEHSTLYVRGLVKDIFETGPVTDSTEKTPVTFSNDGKVYFNGVLSRINISRCDAVYCLEVYAVSHTVSLDVRKYKRSFQDNGETYESVVKRIINSGESIGKVIFNAPESKVDRILLQYNETDWDFAKRLASHTNSVLIPVTASGTPSFYFGVQEEGSGDIDTHNFAISKDFDLYRRMVDEPGFAEGDSVTYTVETDDFLDYELGGKINFNGQTLYVRRASMRLADAAMFCTYALAPKAAISAPKIYNRDITGLVLEGTVMKAENDDIKIHLSIDQDEYNRLDSDITPDVEKAHFFEYATGYSAEGHTGWYVMPEEGDMAQLLFPKEDEWYAYASACVRQDDTERTTDPLVKYLRTPFGKEIKLDEKEILITSRDDETFIRINEDTGIEIITPKPIRISSGSTMDIFSEDDMTITTKKNLTITADASITMINDKNNVNITPKSGIAAYTDQKLQINSDDDAFIGGKKEVTITSGKDMSLSSDKKLIESARSAIELSCSGSSVKMDGNIDMKARLIKEN